MSATIDDLVATVKSGQRIGLGIPEPTVFLEALARRRDLEDVTLIMGSPGPGTIAVAANPGIRLLTLFASPPARELVSSGRIEYLPLTFHGLTGFLPRWAPDLAVLMTAAPEADGRLRPGSTMAHNDSLVASLKPGGRAYALVDDNQPQVLGEAFTVDDFTALIPVPPLPPGSGRQAEHSPLAGQVAGFLDELVSDGATLEAGVGSLADDALSRLVHKKGLGIHTEVLGPGLCTLVEAGAADGAAKPNHTGKVDFTISVQGIAGRIADNPAYYLSGAQTCVNPLVIAANPLLRCFNSALEIDFGGQANAEVVAGQQYGGVGGQVDFLRACRLVDDALSVMVLESTAAGGTISRIVPDLPAGHVATATRYDVDVVVTEYGIAWLRDLSLAERARNLAAIAHPDFRDDLAAAARGR
ncbi:MAG TPA: acetyl-CoA hydrolase/transferase C-terminal domain-containing protein [Alphaproteobacteria bacterium]|jgi:4-hydroxybutyrate CoA-transferase|nr:acetyl-CoA hydrolase/transferase C-terminal domain-containing protein [Alphaproteobacteria bacterium]MDP6270945.1 acetyl-CoA hydrolase/transferase C-terminal domain-containing protein [Alphaproteobacteria bacterium]HJM48884.1 acetyl-CoA hydrolase/transferase C-terminal domain-containing protein [Alphaproteobacteria bacterium]